MWILHRKSDGKCIYLLNKEYTIGRKNCTIELSDDLSVSRRHLTIVACYSRLGQESGQPTIKVMDLGSTYGVFTNSTGNNPTKIEANKWFPVGVDTTLQFGMNNEWTVKWKDIKVVCSAIASSERKNLNHYLAILGAKLVLNWDDEITYLVTNKIVLTQKVLDSLIFAKPIVELKFFETWVQMLEKNPCSLEPDVSMFTPVIGQETLGEFGKQVFLPQEKRRSLFLGKTFVFATTEESKSSMAQVAVKAGAKITASVESFINNNSVLIESSNLKTPEGYIRLLRQLNSRGERCIPEKEIGQAILACSVERFCNPFSMCVEQQVFDDQGSTQATIGFTDSFPNDPNTLLDNSLRLPMSTSRESEEPPFKRNRIENDFKHPKALEPAKSLKEKRKRDSPVNDLKLLKSLQENDSTNVKFSLQNPGCQPPPKKIHTDGLAFDVEARVGTSVSEWDLNQQKPPVIEREFNQVSITSKSKICPKNESDDDIPVTQSIASCEKYTGRANSSTIKRISQALSPAVKSEQWIIKEHGQLNTSKTMLRSSLVRQENARDSQKSTSSFKVVKPIFRISSMKTAHFKEGKWSLN